MSFSTLTKEKEKERDSKTQKASRSKVEKSKENTPAAASTASAAATVPTTHVTDKSSTNARKSAAPTTTLATTATTTNVRLTTDPPILGRTHCGRAKTSGGNTLATLPSSSGNEVIRPSAAAVTPARVLTLGGHSGAGMAANHCDPQLSTDFLKDSDYANEPEKDEDLEDDGIVAASRLALARMSFENVVVAVARLQDLMMAHAAAVTSAQQREAKADGAVGALKPQPQLPMPCTRVNTRAIMARSLDDIADDLAKQLTQLCDAYQSSSRAERLLMGLQPISGSLLSQQSPSALPLNAAAPPPSTALVQSSVGPGGNRRLPDLEVDAQHFAGATNASAFDTFGPMNATLPETTGGNFEFVDSRPPGGRENDWAINVGQANPGPRLAYENTHFVYPDGTRVSFPVSTFGEMVSTQVENPDARMRSWANEVDDHALPMGAGCGFGGAQASTSVRKPCVTVSQEGRKSEATQTDNLNPNGMDTELLSGYLKALESRLSDKQRLEAMRDARSGKTKDERKVVSSSLSHLALTKSLSESQAGTLIEHSTSKKL